VALRQSGLGSTQAIHAYRVPRYCLQTINVLSDPGNRTAIQAELALATDFCKNDKGEVLILRIRLSKLSRFNM
jgi:hypothetical protein